MDCISRERLLTREEAARFCGTTVEFLMNCARRRRNGPPFYRYSTRRYFTTAMNCQDGWTVAASRIRKPPHKEQPQHGECWG